MTPFHRKFSFLDDPEPESVREGSTGDDEDTVTMQLILDTKCLLLGQGRQGNLRAHGQWIIQSSRDENHDGDGGRPI